MAVVAVDEVVVEGAEQNKVVEIGASSVEPGVDVVGVALPGGEVAVPGAAVAVAGGEGAALVGGDESAAAADVEDRGAAAGDDPSDVAVAQQSFEFGAGDLGAVDELA